MTNMGGGHNFTPPPIQMGGCQNVTPPLRWGAIQRNCADHIIHGPVITSAPCLLIHENSVSILHFHITAFLVAVRILA